MAPESERAQCGKQMSEWNYNVGAILCNREANHDGQCSHTYQWQNFTYQQPTEPTLTCSEVVERLPAKEFLKRKREQWTDLTGYKFAGKPTIDDQACQFAEAYADAILHSWRERRVQELPILEKFEDEIALHGGFGLTIDQLENLRAALVSAIGKANYPRREQIRKGAKHE